MSSKPFIITDLDTTGWNSMAEYFEWNDMNFDFLPRQTSVPLVDVISDRIKGKDKVFLMIDPETTLKTLYNQKSKYNDFLDLAKKIKLLLYAEDDMMNKLHRTFQNTPEIASWINDLSPIIFTEGLAGRFFKETFPKCVFYHLWHNQFHHSMSHPELYIRKNRLGHRPEKDFLCLMCRKKDRPHRDLLDARLAEEDLLKNAIYRFRERDDETWNDLEHSYSKKLLDNTTFYEGLPPIDVYTKTNIELVAETFTAINHDESFFVTEKTLKPMSMGHPFMILSNYNFLKNLRELGFKTFHDHLDESYDDQQDVTNRIDVIVKNLKMLEGNSSLFYDDVKHITEHNHRHLQNMSGQWKTTLWRTLDEFWRNI